MEYNISTVKRLIQSQKRSFNGADFAVFAIIEHRKVSVPFTNGQEEVTVDVVEDYALDFDDLTDLADSEYALETSLGKLLKRLEKEDSFYKK